MRKPSAGRPSAKDLLADLTTRDKSESKHKELFFVPPGKSVDPPKVATKQYVETAISPPAPVQEPSQPIAVAPPTEEELGVSWTDRLRKLLALRSVVLVVADGDNVKLLPIDDLAFIQAAEALKTRPA